MQISAVIPAPRKCRRKHAHLSGSGSSLSSMGSAGIWLNGAGAKKTNVENFQFVVASLKNCFFKVLFSLPWRHYSSSRRFETPARRTPVPQPRARVRALPTPSPPRAPALPGSPAEAGCLGRARSCALSGVFVRLPRSWAPGNGLRGCGGTLQVSNRARAWRARPVACAGQCVLTRGAGLAAPRSFFRSGLAGEGECRGPE